MRDKLHYHEEGLLAEFTAEERYRQRIVKVKSLLDAFFTWLDTLQVSGKNKLVDAVQYARNEKQYPYTFLEDGLVYGVAWILLYTRVFPNESRTGFDAYPENPSSSYI